MKKSVLLFSLLLSFSLRADESPSRLFADASPLEFSLEGDFVKIFNANVGGNPDHEDRKDPKYWSDASIDINTEGKNDRLKGQIRARGNSSGREGEGTFPKILVELDKGQNLGNTVFKGNRKFRINTHVTTHPTTKYTGMGRLNSEISTWREALAYDVARALGLIVPGTRRARITYTEVTTGEVFTRLALLVETDGNLSERTGLKIVSMEEFDSKQDTGITPYDSALLHLFQAFVGNDDFVLRTSQEPPNAKGPAWDYGNVIVFERPNGERFVGPYDFDRSTWVGGEGYLDYARGGPIAVEDQLNKMVGWLVNRHPDLTVREAVRNIVDRCDEVKRVIRNASIDEEGREIASKHVERFLTMAKLRFGIEQGK
jgi:hypothetical protein